MGNKNNDVVDDQNAFSVGNLEFSISIVQQMIRFLCFVGAFVLYFLHRDTNNFLTCLMFQANCARWGYFAGCMTLIGMEL